MISVIVPTYNEENNIENCLKSLRKQTFPKNEYEIIVVDGNSNDRTREIAEPLADRVIIQTSKKVGGARNDGAKIAQGNIIATTDADCIIPENWLDVINHSFEVEEDIVTLYGLIYPIEDTFKHRLSLSAINILSRLGYVTGSVYYTLGCNTAFDKDAFFRAGMYNCIDAGDDLEIAIRMKKIGRVVLNPDMRVGFSMRRYEQFGTIKSLYEWLYIVLKGGEDSKYSYSKREYESEK